MGSFLKSVTMAVEMLICCEEQQNDEHGAFYFVVDIVVLLQAPLQLILHTTCCATQLC